MITREEFERMILIKPNCKLRQGVPVRVYRFLLEHKDIAYTSGEILKDIHVIHSQIIGALKRLHKIGYIENNKPYWIISSGQVQEEQKIKELRK